MQCCEAFFIFLIKVTQVCLDEGFDTDLVTDFDCCEQTIRIELLPVSGVGIHLARVGTDGTQLLSAILIV